MKNIALLTLVSGLLTFALPGISAQAADMGVRMGVDGTRCERKLARCMKWFPSMAERCHAKAARCEAREARHYDRRMAWHARRGM